MKIVGDSLQEEERKWAKYLCWGGGDSFEPLFKSPPPPQTFRVPKGGPKHLKLIAWTRWSSFFAEGGGLGHLYRGKIFLRKTFETAL